MTAAHSKKSPDTSRKQDSNEESPPMRARLAAEHVDLELLAGNLREVVAAGGIHALDAPWRRFEEGLAQHLATEEAELLPTFERFLPREAEALRRAHGMLRKHADALALRVELRIVRPGEIEALLVDLRNHGADEERAFRHCAELSGMSAR